MTENFNLSYLIKFEPKLTFERRLLNKISGFFQKYKVLKLEKTFNMVKNARVYFLQIITFKQWYLTPAGCNRELKSCLNVLRHSLMMLKRNEGHNYHSSWGLNGRSILTLTLTLTLTELKWFNIAWHIMCCQLSQDISKQKTEIIISQRIFIQINFWIVIIYSFFNL